MNEPMPSRREGCPDDVALERCLAGEAPFAGAVRRHAEACSSCASRLGWMEEAGELFARRVFPATRDGVVEALSRRRGFAPGAWGAWAPLVGAAAALVLLFPVLRPAPVSPDYVGVKGASAEVRLPVHVYVSEGGRARQLSTGDVVHPGDGLRFVVEAPGREVFLASVDQTGRVSRLVPGDTAVVPDTGIVPGGSVLDGVLGPERIFAVVVGPGARPEDVESALREAVARGGAASVRALERLPVAAPQGTLLLEKVAR